MQSNFIMSITLPACTISGPHASRVHVSADVSTVTAHWPVGQSYKVLIISWSAVVSCLTRIVEALSSCSHSSSCCHTYVCQAGRSCTCIAFHFALGLLCSLLFIFRCCRGVKERLTVQPRYCRQEERCIGWLGGRLYRLAASLHTTLSIVESTRLSYAQSVQSWHSVHLGQAQPYLLRFSRHSKLDWHTADTVGCSTA